MPEEKKTKSLSSFNSDANVVFDEMRAFLDRKEELMKERGKRIPEVKRRKRKKRKKK